MGKRRGKQGGGSYGDDERSRDRHRRRREFRDKKHAGLDRLSNRLGEIESRAAESEDVEDHQIGSQAQALRKKKKRVRERIDELAAAPDESWGEDLDDFEEDWQELEEDWQELARRITKRGWRLPDN